MIAPHQRLNPNSNAVTLATSAGLYDKTTLPVTVKKVSSSCVGSGTKVFHGAKKKGSLLPRQLRNLAEKDLQLACLPSSANPKLRAREKHNTTNETIKIYEQKVMQPNSCTKRRVLEGHPERRETEFTKRRSIKQYNSNLSELKQMALYEAYIKARGVEQAMLQQPT